MALKKLVRLQSAIHEWSGLVMDPVMYTLIEPTTPFVLVANPGKNPHVQSLCHQSSNLNDQQTN
jgi:hypothetical protein